MAADGWFPSWFEAAYFPPVWFAPGDESQVSEEELREEYHGHGRRGRRTPSHRQPEYRTQYRDATDADIRALVEAKWDAIDKSSPPAAPTLAEATDKPANAPTNAPADAPPAEPVVLANPILLTRAQKAARTRAANQAAKQETQRRNDDALVLALLELA